MTGTPGFETFIVGLLCGAVFGVAGSISRRILGLLFGLGAAGIVFVVVDKGVAGLEGAVRGVLDEALRHQHLVIGAIVGATLAASVLSRGGRHTEGEER